jgi:hypothetical protein
VVGLVTMHVSVFDINFSIVAEVIESNQVPSEISIGKLDINRIMDTRFWQRRGLSTDYDWIDQIHIQENSNNGFTFDTAMNVFIQTPGIFSMGTEKSVEDTAENDIAIKNLEGELTQIFTSTEGGAEMNMAIGKTDGPGNCLWCEQKSISSLNKISVSTENGTTKELLLV